MKNSKTPIGQQIKCNNELIITTRITLIMGVRLRLMKRYSGTGHMINQEDFTRLIENQEALAQSINSYLQVGSE